MNGASVLIGLFAVVLVVFAGVMGYSLISGDLAEMRAVELARQEAEKAQADAMQARANALAAQAQAVERQADASIAQSQAIETVAWTGYLTTSTVVVLGIIGMILGMAVMLIGALVIQSWMVRPRYVERRPAPLTTVRIVSGDGTIRHLPPPQGTVAYQHYIQRQEQGAYSEVIDG